MRPAYIKTEDNRTGIVRQVSDIQCIESTVQSLELVTVPSLSLGDFYFDSEDDGEDDSEDDIEAFTMISSTLNETLAEEEIEDYDGSLNLMLGNFLLYKYL